jgi:hypothetical protein
MKSSLFKSSLSTMWRNVAGFATVIVEQKTPDVLVRADLDVLGAESFRMKAAHDYALPSLAGIICDQKAVYNINVVIRVPLTGLPR